MGEMWRNSPIIGTRRLLCGTCSPVHGWLCAGIQFFLISQRQWELQCWCTGHLSPAVISLQEMSSLVRRCCSGSKHPLERSRIHPVTLWGWNVSRFSGSWLPSSRLGLTPTLSLSPAGPHSYPATSSFPPTHFVALSFQARFVFLGKKNFFLI